MNHAAEHLCRDIFFGERIISFERAETNHAKVASRPNNSPMRRRFTLHIICINFQVVFFADNFPEFATLNAFYEKIFKLHILIESRWSIF